MQVHLALVGVSLFFSPSFPTAPGLVDAQTLAPDIVVELKYASPNNFMGEAMYGDLRRCFLQKEAALMLAQAQEELSRRRPGFRLLLLDCLRPRAVQRRMWSLVQGTPQRRYVANPQPGSLHNHGAAVDISIVDARGERLDMGTPPDCFAALAEPRHEQRFLAAGMLTGRQIANRELLRAVMGAASWRGIQREWWHFEAQTKEVVRARYPLVEELPSFE